MVDQDGGDGTDEASGDESEQCRTKETGEGEGRAFALVFLKGAGKEFDEEAPAEESDEKRHEREDGGQPRNIYPEAGLHEIRCELPEAEADPCAGAKDEGSEQDSESSPQQHETRTNHKDGQGDGGEVDGHGRDSG